MSGITFDYNEEYIRGLIYEESDILRDIEEFAHENQVPIVQKETARFLQVMLTIKKPLNILELGTAVGYSAILMSMYTDKNSKITTIERDINMIKQAKKNIEKYKLQDRIKIKQGDCLQVLKELNDKYDFIFMDAGKGHYNHFLPECLRLMNKNAVIVADNVLFRGMVANNELVKRRKITIVKRMRSYLDMVSKDKQLITSVIPMGDGIAVTTRREIVNE